MALLSKKNKELSLENIQLKKEFNNVIYNSNSNIDEVNDAVSMMSECINELIGFLESNVLTDYATFSKVSDQYRNDASTFNDSMTRIDQSIAELSGNINQIADAIAGINTTIDESANGITDIAQKTTDMGGETADATAQVAACRERVKELNEIISVFKR